MMETAKLIIGDKIIELPVITGTEGEKAIDITSLRQKTGYITLDPGLGNTGSCKSAITFLDGEKGILRYRGIPVEQLAEQSTFVETAYLLVNGHLPSLQQIRAFSVSFNDQSLVHEDMRTFFQNFPPRSHPMGILSAMLNALRSFYPEIQLGSEEEFNLTVARIISKVRTMAAMSYKISKGHRVVYPSQKLDFCSNFLNMMFDNPVKPYDLKDEAVK
ncbi:MAG: citrate (Si)-synthase, partial [Desulfobacteraceae bacterium]|nr:citrate (Si)-synthase [Desulfobacteraceae bacterium]